MLLVFTQVNKIVLKWTFYSFILLSSLFIYLSYSSKLTALKMVGYYAIAKLWAIFDDNIDLTINLAGEVYQVTARTVINNKEFIK